MLQKFSSSRPSTVQRTPSQAPADTAGTLLGRVLAPHVAAHTVEAINNMGLMSAQNAVEVLLGQRNEWILNAAAIAKERRI